MNIRYSGLADLQKQGKVIRLLFQGLLRILLTGNPVVGAVIYVEKIKAGAVTNNVGFYSLTIAKRSASGGMQDGRDAFCNKKHYNLLRWGA